MKAFESCKWVHHKKAPIGPSKRWGHTATLLGDHIYIFGGKLDQESRKFNQCFYSLDCEDYSFQRLDTIRSPQLRDSHTSFVVQGCLYIWGGCINQEVKFVYSHIFKNVVNSPSRIMQVSNECFVFNGKEWAAIQQNGKIPHPRESQISTVLGNRYVLMYGGCRQQQIFSDFNIFDAKNRTWYSLKVLGQTLPVLENASLTLINNQIYLFGGQSTLVPIQVCNGITGGQSRQIYHNELYWVQLSSLQFENEKHPPVITIHRMRFHNKPPPQRSTHCAVGYADRYLIVLGGQTYSRINHENADLLNDIWCFDLHSGLWREIKPASSHLFKKHANFSAVLCRQQIIVFGGLKSVDDCTSYDELLSLKLFDPEEYKLNSICAVCRLVYKNAVLSEDSPSECLQYQQHSNTKSNKSNIRTVYKTAQLISHPFEAIKLLIYSSLLTDATRIHIELRQVQGRQVLVVTDNGLRMEKTEFQWIISNIFTLKPEPIYTSEEPTQYSYTKSLIDYSKFLKYGGFKLGRGVYVSHINHKGEMISVLTDQTVYYYFMEYHKEGKYYELQKKNTYLNDYEMVSPLLSKIGQDDPNVKNYTTRKVIYNLHSEDQGCLHRLESTPNDINLLKKSQFKINQHEGTYVESLREFISTLFLEPVNVQISVNSSEIVKLEAQSSGYDASSYQKISDCNLQSQTGLEINIYYNPHRLNNEIKIYRNNFLITKSRRHQRGQYCGYIIVPLNWQPNLFETGFQNDPEFIYDAIDYLIKQHQLRRNEKEPNESLTSC